ncbi:MAG: ABC transporter ATP-binding protein [Opitutae bacterium]|nr:ABC transporter ATP-binding protein [Opitutae bacterium]
MDRPGAIALREVSKVFVPAEGKLPWPKVFGGRHRAPKAGLQALDCISFEVKPGEVIGIIGRNGSGKSTLLQIIAGTLQPTSGDVYASGRICALLELGSGFNPDFSGLENIFLSASLAGLGRKETEKRLQEIIDFSGIGEFLDFPVRTYSSGMTLRLAFAIQTQVNPEILIVDEALAVGDIFFQQKCFSYLQEDLKDATRIFVTHDLDTLSKVAPRTLVLDQGKLIFDGQSKDAIELYVKMAQSEAFGRAEGPPVPQDVDAQSLNPENLPWVSLSEEQASGRGEIQISRSALTTLDGNPASILRMGESYVLHFELVVGKAPIDLVLGYIVHDRQGQNVCGGTSMETKAGPVVLSDSGLWKVEFIIVWPALRADEYTITVGVGEGSSVDNQVIQCWGNNLFCISSSLNGLSGDQLLTLPAKEVHVRQLKP